MNKQTNTLCIILFTCLFVCLQVGLSDREQEDIFRLVSAVLWMGNISFEEDSSGKQTTSRVDKQGQEALANTANLLQLAPEDLHTALTSRIMTTTRGGAMGTVYQVRVIEYF